MEMHQVRYFLAVARALNFTRAAEECNVAQPSLTRAIRQLEAEFGGDLFRRERPQAQLTELGLRMHPLLRQCYESALGARSLASSLKSGEVGSLRLALSHSIDLALITPQLQELKQHFNRLEFKFMRGASAEIAEYLKNGQAELAIASDLGDTWERLDAWPLFTETFQLMVSGKHYLADRQPIDIVDLRAERLLVRTYCEHTGRLAELLREREIDVDHAHEIASERDLMTLLDANMGFAVVPRSAEAPDTLVRSPIAGVDMRRTVYLYG